jgi:hypothetical protein
VASSLRAQDLEHGAAVALMLPTCRATSAARRSRDRRCGARYSRSPSWRPGPPYVGRGEPSRRSSMPRGAGSQVSASLDDPSPARRASSIIRSWPVSCIFTMPTGRPSQARISIDPRYRGADPLDSVEAACPQRLRATRMSCAAPLGQSLILQRCTPA